MRRGRPLPRSWPSTPSCSSSWPTRRVHADQGVARRLGRRYAELTPIVTAPTSWPPPAATSRPPVSSVDEDAVFAAEAEAIAQPGRRAGDRTGRVARPARPGRRQGRDPRGQGRRGRRGVRAVRRRPAADVPALRRAPGLEDRDALGAPSPISAATRTSRSRSRRRSPAPADGVWARLKFEGGVHRVQRVPVTESQGRIHTSAAGVLVAPEAEDVEVDDRPQRPADRRLPVVRARAGSRSTPPTPPSGSPTCPPASWCPARTRSRSCRTRNRRCASCAPGCWPRPRATADAAASDARRSQVRTVDRSERVRTYNFPENRIADHRVGYKAYNLDAVLDGDLDAVLDALENADRAERLAIGRRALDERAVSDCGARHEPAVAAGRHHVGVRDARGRRRAQPGGRRRGTGRVPDSGCPRTRLGMTPLVESDWVDRLPGRWSPAGGADPAAAPDRRAVQIGRARMAGRSRGVHPAAGDRVCWSLGARRRSSDVRTPVVVDLCAGQRRDRAGRRGRPARTPG